MDFPVIQEAQKDYKDLKVAIVHYWLVSWRGGEKVVDAILKLFPQADIYTLFYDPESIPERIRNNHKITASYLNDIPFFRKNYQKVFPFYPQGIKSLSLKDKDYDLVISNESGPAKGIELPVGAKHICLCQTPMRYCWGFRDEYIRDLPFPVKQITDYCFERLRQWDETTKNNVGLYLANSTNVQNRVNKFYGLPAEVLHPPVSLDYFKIQDKKPENPEKEPFYLLFGALTPYKRADIAVNAFNESKKNLVIIGTGSEYEKLKRLAAPNVKLLGGLDDDEVQAYLTHAEALIFPGEEDFGIVPLEAQAKGTPVIAYGKGGVLDTVIPCSESPKEGQSKCTGIFFPEQTPESLNATIIKFGEIKECFQQAFLQQHARTFGEDKFLEKFKEYLDGFLAKSLSAEKQGEIKKIS